MNIELIFSTMLLWFLTDLQWYFFTECQCFSDRDFKFFLKLISNEFYWFSVIFVSDFQWKSTYFQNHGGHEMISKFLMVLLSVYIFREGEIFDKENSASENCILRMSSMRLGYKYWSESLDKKYPQLSPIVSDHTWCSFSYQGTKKDAQFSWTSFLTFGGPPAEGGGGNLSDGLVQIVRSGARQPPRGRGRYTPLNLWPRRRLPEAGWTGQVIHISGLSSASPEEMIRKSEAIYEQHMRSFNVCVFIRVGLLWKNLRETNKVTADLAARSHGDSIIRKFLAFLCYSGKLDTREKKVIIEIAVKIARGIR